MATTARSEQVRVGQVWRRVRGVKPGTLVVVDYIDQWGVSWRGFDNRNYHGGLYIAEWLRNYEFVREGES